MNYGEVVVCDQCDEPFEILRDKYGEMVFCPYCGEEAQ